MKVHIRRIVLLLLVLCWTGTPVLAGDFNVKSHGHFKKMVHMKKSEGVVNLQKAIPSADAYGVGAIQQGTGEITVINGEVWLDYGKDGFGKSVKSVPAEEQAVLLVTSQVAGWQEIPVQATFTRKELYNFIQAQAGQHGLDVDAPFPFLLEGKFDNLSLHVINGRNPKFGGHGEKGHFFKQVAEVRNNQQALVVGFYSAATQGVYTHPGESWHLHAVIKDENIGAHVDDITLLKGSTLKLPVAGSQ